MPDNPNRWTSLTQQQNINLHASCNNNNNLKQLLSVCPNKLLHWVNQNEGICREFGPNQKAICNECTPLGYNLTYTSFRINLWHSKCAHYTLGVPLVPYLIKINLTKCMSRRPNSGGCAIFKYILKIVKPWNQPWKGVRIN